MEVVILGILVVFLIGSILRNMIKNKKIMRRENLIKGLTSQIIIHEQKDTLYKELIKQKDRINDNLERTNMINNDIIRIQNIYIEHLKNGFLETPLPPNSLQIVEWEYKSGEKDYGIYPSVEIALQEIIKSCIHFDEKGRAQAEIANGALYNAYSAKCVEDKNNGVFEYMFRAYFTIRMQHLSDLCFKGIYNYFKNTKDENNNS